MERTYWHKQAESALFPDLMWSQPENKRLAGKLLVVGGNAHSFALPAEAYANAEKAGAGAVRVLLPNYLQKTVSQLFPAADFAASTPGDGFGRQALGELLSLSVWADGVLVAGDLGRNSETAILLEQFSEKYQGQLSLAKDAIDYYVTSPGQLLERDNTLLVVDFNQLQKLARGAHFLQAFTSNMGLLRLVDALHEFTSQHPVHLITLYSNNLILATNGQISSTAVPVDSRLWQLATATQAAVWWLQNPSKAFEALTTACFLTYGTAGRT